MLRQQTQYALSRGDDHRVLVGRQYFGEVGGDRILVGQNVLHLEQKQPIRSAENQNGHGKVDLIKNKMLQNAKDTKWFVDIIIYIKYGFFKTNKYQSKYFRAKEKTQ